MRLIDTDRISKVIRGLNCHVNGHPHTRCHGCPYWGTGPHGSSECNTLAADALVLLKSYQPRVMELEEVLDLQFDDVVYVQSKATGAVMSAIVVAVFPELPDIDIGVIQLRQAGGYNGIYNTELGYYGKIWRCWTAMPSEEQRRETAWSD